MIWAMRVLPIGEAYPVQQEFHKQFMLAGGPRNMMLVSVSERSETQLYMALPDDSWLTKFGGLLPVLEEMLPMKANFLVGHEDEFAKRFLYIDR